MSKKTLFLIGIIFSIFLINFISAGNVGIRDLYENSFGTGIAIKPDWADGWIDDPVNLILNENYIIKYIIDNQIEDSTNNIRVIVKINKGITGYERISENRGRGRGRGGEKPVYIPIYANETILADYNTSINQSHINEVNLNTTGLQGTYNLSVFVEKINETDYNLTDNYAQREITIITPEPQPPECYNDSDCTADYYSEKYCSGGDVYWDWHNFSCVDGYCVEDIIKQLVDECDKDEDCEDGECVEEDNHHNHFNYEDDYLDDNEFLRLSDKANKSIQRNIIKLDGEPKTDEKNAFFLIFFLLIGIIILIILIFFIIYNKP